jgi:uncharacterized protein (TIGR03437 family)
MQADTIYVCSQLNGTVTAYDAVSGAVQAPIASGLNNPTGLAVDASGNLYISDFGNNVIRKYVISTGTLSAFAALPSGSGPFGVAFDPAGSAYVSALNTGLIYKFDSNGVRQGGTAAVAAPRGIAYNPADGNLYVVSTGSTDAIYKLTPDLSASLFFQSDANHHIMAPRYLAFNRVTGRLLVSNEGSANFNGTIGTDTGFIEQFNGSTDAGAVLSSVLGPNGLAFDAGANQLYFTEFFGNDVRVSARAGQSSILTRGIAGANGLAYSIVSPATAPLALSQTGVTFRAVTGSTNLQRSVSVFAVTKAVSWTAVSSTISGGNWLQVTPATGTSDPSQPPPTIQIAASAASLQPGDYYGLVTIKPTNIESSQIVSVVLSVLPAAQSPGAIVEPTGFLFVAAPGGAVPAAQNGLISNPSTAILPFNTASTFSSPTTWFKYGPTGGNVIPGQPLSFSVQPIENLPAGIYSGSVSFVFLDGNTRVVNLLLVVAAGAIPSGVAQAALQAPPVCKPAKLLPVFTLLGVNFTSPAAWPAAIEVSITDDCGSPMSSGAVAASFSNGDPPLALSSFQSGRWSATWTPQHPFSSLTVKLNAESFTPALTGSAQISGSAPANPQVPIIGVGGVVGAASYASSPAPGTLIALFGTALADRLAGANGLPLPYQLATTSVILKGALVPLVYVNENQINALVPYQLPTKAKYQIIVQRGLTLSSPETIAIFDSQPAVFTTDQSGKGQGHIYIVGSDSSQALAAPESPATAGDVLTVYCAGLGEVQPALVAGLPAPFGQLENTVNLVTATIGGVAADVLFAGLTPGFTGLYQVNMTVPAGVKPGVAVPLVLAAAGITSQPVSMAIR